MVLADWKLMRTRRLKQLDEALASYRQYISEQAKEELTPEEAKARWQREAEFIARIHDAIHQLRDALNTDIFIANMVGGSPLKELPKLALEKPSDVFADLRDIRSSFPKAVRKMSAERSSRALLVVDELITYVEKQLKEIHAADRDKTGGIQGNDEARALFEFLALVSNHNDMSIVDPQTRDFAEEIWKMLKERDDVLCHELRDMKPQLTWGETLYHFLKDLETQRGDINTDRQRKHVIQYLFPAQEFYCLDCDHPFAVDSRHSEHFVCPRCQAKERKRRERQRKRDNSSEIVISPSAKKALGE